ncbi:MAG: sugar transferase [Acetatifactor sp.]|nr:sugar transferase [Acetatifactor sp.]
MNRSNIGANTNVFQMISDIIMILLVFLLEKVLFGNYLQLTTYLKCMALVIVYGVVFILSNKEARLYNVTFFFYMDRTWKLLTKSWLIASVTTIVLIYLYNPGERVRIFHLYYLLILYVAMCFNMVLTRLIQMFTSNRRAPRSAYVGLFEEYEKFNYFLNKTNVKVENVGYILESGKLEDKKYNVLGNLSDLENIIRDYELDQVFFIVHANDVLLQRQDYIDLCLEMGITVKVVMDVNDRKQMQRANSFVSSVGTYPLITYHTIALNAYEQFMKRIMDIIISFLGIIITSPIMLISAVAIKLDSPGEVLFKQLRVGQNGRTFYMYKFRSMCKDAEKQLDELRGQNQMQGAMFKIADDPRITKVGKFIRRTSIDELPQFFNVLKGEMSIVGTRPPTVDEVAQYKRSQWRRISIKPGITGMWQISGRNQITDFDKVVELDLEYIDNWTLFSDLVIIFKTMSVLFKRKGAY